MVCEWGGAVPYFDPTKQTELTEEQRVWQGKTRKRAKLHEPHSGEYAITPEERLADKVAKQKRIRRERGTL